MDKDKVIEELKEQNKRFKKAIVGILELITEACQAEEIGELEEN